MTIRAKIKSLSYLVQSRPFPLEKPIVIQFPVIDICNSRCQMCRIWENHKSNDITSDDLRKGLSNPLYSEVRSVGLNGGEPTLRKDLGTLTEVLFEKLPKLKNIALITNAYKYEEVITRIADVGKVVKAHGGHLDVMVSLDGYGEMHDLVRGRPGNFKRAQNVIDFIQNTDLVGTVRIGCTIIKENVYGLADLFEYCQQKGLYIKYRLGVPHQRLYTRDLKEPYDLTDEDRYHVAEFLEGLIAHYETGEHQKFFYRSLIGQLVQNQPRKAGCDWQHRGATITSKGELLYCAVESPVLGRIHEGDSKTMFFDGQDHLAEIVRTKCADCNHDYVGLPDKVEHRRQTAKRLLARTGLIGPLRQVYQRSGLRGLRRARAYDARVAKLKTIGAGPRKAQPAGGRPRVLIGGWYGTETLGDKAILAGVGKAIEDVLGPCDFTLASLYPYVSRMTVAQMPEFAGWTICTPEEAAAGVATQDLVVFGGGPMMAIHELAEMEAFFELAQSNGIPRLVAGCGVGPLGEEHLNAAIGRILKMADWCIYRDAKSRDAAKGLGVDTGNDFVAEDPAFTWLATQRPLIPRTPPAKGEQVLLLGLREFPYAAYARNMPVEEAQAAGKRFEASVVEAITMLVRQNPGLVIRPLPMCTNHFGDDDRWFYRRLLRDADIRKERLDLSLLGRELPPVEYVQAFRGASAALTMRFHSVVFALGLDLPTVVIDYTLGRGKVRALADRFDLPCRDLTELTTDFMVGALQALLDVPRVAAHDYNPAFPTDMARVLAGINPGSAKKLAS